MIELTIWPPKVGKPSTSTTLRPSLAASRAAEMPALPAPTTQMSALTSCGDLLSRRTVLVSVATASAISTPHKTPDLAPASMPTRVLQDHSSAFLRNHHGRGIGVARRDGRHDRGVDHANCI